MSLSKVSIVVPVYNATEFIHQLIETLEHYYNEGCELIFVEDGSYNPVKEIILEAFPNANYIWQENKGAASARNTGVNSAQGEFIQLMDVDDTITTDKIRIQLECAMDTDADIVYSDWRNLYIDTFSDKREFKPWNIEKQHNDIIHRSLCGWWTPTPCPLIRRQAYLDIGGMNEKLKVGEDTYFFHELAIRGYKYVYCPGKFFVYHRYVDKETLSQNFESKELYKEVVHEILRNDFRVLTELGILADYRNYMTNERFHVARDMAGDNFEESAEMVKLILELDKNYFPEDQSLIYRLFYRLFGYKVTEGLSLMIYQNLKQLVDSKH